MEVLLEGPRAIAHAILSKQTPIKRIIPGLSRADVKASWDGIFEFDRRVPRTEQAKWTLHVPRDPEFIEPDDGVICKNEKDRKIYLHWRPDTEVLLSMHGIELTDWQRAWFAALQRVYARCVESQYQIAIAMDQLHPGFAFAPRYIDATRHNQHCVRVLKYECRNGTVANKHCDRDALTDHLCESADGLYTYNDGERILRKTPATPGSTLFTGNQLMAITDGAIPSLFHEVDDTTGGQRERYAMVFFGKMRKDDMLYL